jgi:hypothetical protein
VEPLLGITYRQSTAMVSSEPGARIGCVRFASPKGVVVRLNRPPVMFCQVEPAAEVLGL